MSEYETYGSLHVGPVVKLPQGAFKAPRGAELAQALSEVLCTLKSHRPFTAPRHGGRRTDGEGRRAS